MEPWPADSTNRSLSGHAGSFPHPLRNRPQSAKAAAAAPMGRPGCPEFAFCTPSADMNLIVVIVLSSKLFIIPSESIFVFDFVLLHYNRKNLQDKLISSPLCISSIFLPPQMQYKGKITIMYNFNTRTVFLV